MSRLDRIQWYKQYDELNREILGCPAAAQKDLGRMLKNLQLVATEVSKLEVLERRRMGSPGRAADEKLAELERQVKYIQKMITIARLQFS